MATHYITSSSNTLYVNDTYYYSNISGNINVILNNEGVGTNCKYHEVIVDDASLIQHYGKKYYALTSSVFALSGTAESAPRVCVTSGQQEQTYEPEDWTKIVNIPFLDKREQKYCITVISNYKKLNEFEKLKEDAIYDGIKRIFDYYYKDSSDEVINRYLSYYKFATFEQYYVPYQPNLRIKCQISIPRKYLDAIDKKEIDLTDGSLVFDVNLIGIQKKLDKVINLLKQYHKDMVYYRFKSADVNLKRDYEGLTDVLATINRYLAINKIRMFKDKGTIEFSVDNCFNIINVSYYNQVSCDYIKIGLSQMINESPFNNPSVINFLYQLNEISKIEYCNLLWIDFINKYYFPIQNIPPLKDPLEKYTNNLVSTLKSSLQISVEQFMTKEERAAEIENLLKINFRFTEDFSGIQATKRTFDAYKKVMKSFRESLVIEAGSSILVGDASKFLRDISKENIIEKLKKMKICEFSFQALECLSLLIQIDIIDQIKISFTYDEQKNDLIPSLANEEKKILLRHILNNKAITKQSVYKILKNYEKDVNTLKSIKYLNNEELIEFLIGYMVA